MIGISIAILFLGTVVSAALMVLAGHVGKLARAHSLQVAHKILSAAVEVPGDAKATIKNEDALERLREEALALALED